MPIKQAVPLLRVTDVARSMEWYRGTFGFVGDPFPTAPPHEFAILRQGQAELMLRRGSPPVRSKPRQYDWDVYLRREGERFREAYAAFSTRGIVTRRLERMFYGLAEFEITDPDGYVILSTEKRSLSTNGLPAASTRLPTKMVPPASSWTIFLISSVIETSPSTILYAGPHSRTSGGS